MRKGTFLVLLVTITLIACGSARAQVEQAWVATYGGDSSGDQHSDFVTALKVDRLGRVHVTGDSYGTNGTPNIVTIQYSATGQPLWVASYDGARGSEHATAMVLDDSGNIYITGTSDGGSSGADLITLKYDSSGNLLWAARYNGPGNSSDTGDAIQVDAAANVYVTGYSYDYPTAYGNLDAVTVKYDAQGNQIWAVRYDGPAHDEDRGQNLVVDADGNVYVTGFATVECYFEPNGDRVCLWDGLTIKYSPSGEQLWVDLFGSPAARDAFKGIVLDPTGRPVVTGASFSWSAEGSVTSSVATVKFMPNGERLWVARASESVPFAGGGWDMATDSDGNVFVLAVSGKTLKYNPSGRLLWSAEFKGIGSAIVVDGSGNAYSSGVTVEPFGTNVTDIIVVKYDPCGNVLWNSIYNGGPGTFDASYALDLDAAANVYVGGHTRDNVYTNNVNFLTLKLTQTDGPLPPTVTIRAARPLTSEGSGWYRLPGVFTVTRDGETNATLTIRYTISGTASNGVDYTAIADNVVIPAGRRSANVIIRPIDDRRIEHTEFVRLDLLPDPAYRFCAARKGVVFILDNDRWRFWDR